MAARPGARRRGRGRDEVEREDADREAPDQLLLRRERALRGFQGCAHIDCYFRAGLLDAFSHACCFSGRQIYALSADLLCERVAALVAIAVRRTDGVEAAQLSFEQSIACEGCLGCFAPDKNLAARSTRLALSLRRVASGVCTIEFIPQSQPFVFS